MNKKLLQALFVLILIILAGSAAYIVVDNFSSSESLLGMNGENFIALNAQSARARVTRPNKNSSLYFKFTANQRAHLMNKVQKSDGAAIQATLKILGNHKNLKEETPFEFGFLYDKDGDYTVGNGIVSGDFTQVIHSGKDAVSFSMCILDSKNVPSGFFVHGKLPYELAEIRFVDAKIGWDKSSAIDLYAFGINGGTININPDKRFDIAEGAVLFASENNRPMPKIEIGLKPTDSIGTWEKQKRITFYYGKEEFTMRRSFSQNKMTLQLYGCKSGYDVLEFDDISEISSLMLVGNDKYILQNEKGKVYYPLVTDLGLIVDWPMNKWRNKDFELFEWEEIPHVLFFDFANYKVQNEFFTRLAYFAEKAGYKGTLVSDDFVENKHGYNAHDYKDKDLAAFFTAAELQDFRLNNRELLLRDILVKNRIIIPEKDGTYSAGIGSVISISRESPDYLRWQFLAHESWHGIFFTNEAFRHKVSMLYNTFDDTSMEFIKVFWETQNGLNYDRNDDYLMRNEFMAYIMQQKLSEVENYFVSLANRWSVNQNEPELAKYIRDTKAGAFVQAGKELNDYAFNNFGFAAGRVHLVYREDRD